MHQYDYEHSIYADYLPHVLAHWPSSQMRELQAKVDQTRQEADHSRMRADSEESERKRLALEVAIGVLTALAHPA